VRSAGGCGTGGLGTRGAKALPSLSQAKDVQLVVKRVLLRVGRCGWPLELDEGSEFMLYFYAFACVLLAGIVRGFSGFAFASLAIMSLSFFLPLSAVVPTIFLLEVVAGIHLLPAIWRTVEWRSIGLIVGSSIAFTPLGVYALSSFPAEPMKVVLAVFSLIAATLLFFGYQLRRMPTRVEAAATGSFAGLLNGAFGIGGWPIIIFFLGSPVALAVGRASIIASFLAMDISGLLFLYIFDLYTFDSLTLFATTLPALIVGVYLGSKLVGKMSEPRARKIILVILMCMSLLMFAQNIPYFF